MYSQPFWGEMVAAAGAGPRPINRKTLNEGNFTAAIRLLLSPATKKAAEAISNKMRSENGVKRAVASFHRNLPDQGLTCDLLPHECAAWIYDPKADKISKQRGKERENKKSKMQRNHDKSNKSKKGRDILKLSAKAVTILTEHDQIDLKCLKR